MWYTYTGLIYDNHICPTDGIGEQYMTLIYDNHIRATDGIGEQYMTLIYDAICMYHMFALICWSNI